MLCCSTVCLQRAEAVPARRRLQRRVERRRRLRRQRAGAAEVRRRGGAAHIASCLDAAGGWGAPQWRRRHGRPAPPRARGSWPRGGWRVPPRARRGSPGPSRACVDAVRICVMRRATLCYAARCYGGRPWRSAAEQRNALGGVAIPAVRHHRLHAPPQRAPLGVAQRARNVLLGGGRRGGGAVAVVDGAALPPAELALLQHTTLCFATVRRPLSLRAARVTCSSASLNSSRQPCPSGRGPTRSCAARPWHVLRTAMRRDIAQLTTATRRRGAVGPRAPARSAGSLGAARARTARA